MDYANTAGRVLAPVEHRVSGFADISGKAIFVSLLALIAFTAVPYGTAEPWWKAFFVCVVVALSLLAIVESLLSGSWSIGDRALLIPLALAIVFAFLQTIPVGNATVPGITHASWNAISADPFGTRFFALQLLALALAAALLFRYASTENRLGIVIHVIIGVTVASAIFGMMRQTTQHSAGFVLPLIQPGQGYGQFVNQNHFAFLMEMGFGLTLGMILGGGVLRERALIYFASLLPIWTALVLSNSRGGLLAMLAQVVAGVLLFPVVVPPADPSRGGFRVFRVVRLLPVRVFLLTLLLVSVVGGTLWIGGDRLVSRFESGLGELDPAAVSRKEIWQATWEMSKAHPIAGVGMGGYWVAIPGYHNASGTLVPQEAHNDYLELLASGGIIGAAIGIWFCAVLLKRARITLRSPSRFRRAASFGATLGIVGVGVHSLFDFGLHMIVNALIFIALIVIATTDLKDERSVHFG
ncbi:MAG: O-antigen ligase family protein [Pyrinomonadaceae bacterium]|nr:O-antigen ligase family protein [Pyrinomonadaceae bacterium]